MCSFYHIHRALIDEPAVVPAHRTSWWGVVTRASLTNLANPDALLGVWSALENHRIPDAPAMARISLLGIQTIADASPFGGLIAPLWQAFVVDRAGEQWVSAPVVASRCHIATLPEAIRPSSAGRSSFCIEYDAVELVVRIPADFEESVPFPAYHHFRMKRLIRNNYYAFCSPGRSLIFCKKFALSFLRWHRKCPVI